MLTIGKPFLTFLVGLLLASLLSPAVVWLLGGYLSGHRLVIGPQNGMVEDKELNPLKVNATKPATEPQENAGPPEGAQDAGKNLFTHKTSVLQTFTAEVDGWLAFLQLPLWAGTEDREVTLRLARWREEAPAETLAWWVESVKTVDAGLRAPVMSDLRRFFVHVSRGDQFALLIGDFRNRPNLGQEYPGGSIYELGAENKWTALDRDFSFRFFVATEAPEEVLYGPVTD